MHLAFCLYRFTPFGGLERNCLELAQACVRRGHRVTVFTRAWEGERPAEVEVCELAVSAWTNIGLDQAFARALERELARREFDAVVGFNRLPGLDVFYAADPCFLAAHGERALTTRFARHHRTRAAWERELVAPDGTTELLVLTEGEARRYRELHGTPAERLHVLPPGLRAEFLADAHPRGVELRAELGIARDALVVLAVGSDFARKGLDRTLRALARLPHELAGRVWLLAVGAGRPERFERLARALGAAERTCFAGGRADVLAAFQAADLFVHPAREENTGTVLLEALSQGVPVVALGACGYAELVAAAQAGIVLDEPFAQAELERALVELLADDARRAELGARGRAAACAWPMEARTARALEVIERAARQKRAARAPAERAATR